MPVFKVCLKIINKNKMVMMIYIVAFIFVSMIVMSINKRDETPESYSDTKVSVAIISEEETLFTEGLKASLADVSNQVELKDDQEAIQDALFFRAVYMIIRIPEGFTESVLAGKPMTLETHTVPGTYESTQVSLHLNQFMQIAKLYTLGDPDINEGELVNLIADTMNSRANVTLIDPDPNAIQGDLMPFFFNYLAYSYMFVMILGVSSIMLVFNRREIKWRNACGPMNGLKVSMQFLLANGVFALGTWLILVFMCVAFDFRNAFKLNTLYFLLNSIVFALTVLGLSFLLGNLVRGKEASSAIANIVTLSTCFLSGVFVPQAFLGDSVLRVASFFPTYWYVKANAQIAALTRFDFESLKEILIILLIELGFAAAFIIVSLAVGKRKQLRT